MKAIYTIIVLLLWAHRDSTECGIDLEPNEICFTVIYNTYFDLESYVIPLANCTNFKPEYVDKVWDIDTNNHKCVQLYNQSNCGGSSARITPRIPFSFGAWYFKATSTKSVGACQESCIPDVGQEIEFFKTNAAARTTESINITFYFEENFKGKAYPIEVRGCTTVNKLDPSEARYQSLRLSKGACIVAFMGNYTDDVKESHPCLVQDYHSALELQGEDRNLETFGNLYAHPDINPREYLKAVAPCLCNNDPNPEPPPIEAYAILDDFFGQSVKVSLNFTGCKDFASDIQLREWEARVPLSVFVTEGACVQAYQGRKCIDSSYTKLNASVGRLENYKFPYGIRSLSPCTKENVGDETNENISKSESSLSNYLIPILGVGGIVCGILASFLVYMRRRTLRMKSNMREMLSEKEIDEFLQGIRLDIEDSTEEVTNPQSDSESANRSGIGLEPKSLEFAFEMLAQSQPYNFDLEIPPADLKFDTKFPIGEGQYGLVFKGTLMKAEKTLPVAIKTTKPLAAAQYLRALLKEVKVMMYLGQHPKIVVLVGCCTAKLREGELLIVMELCDNGSLEGYLKSNRTTFVNLTKNGEINLGELSPQSECVNHATGEYCIDINPTTSESVACKEMKEDSEFNIHQLISWSIEIAKAMDFLASKKVIHGDLSARNILLSVNKTAKISDFGLARKLYSYEQYIRNGEYALPWRWLALESLKKMEFSTASDIWSYGILMWEIFTLAEQPYDGIPFWSTDFIKNLEEGLRPSFPQFATKNIYDIMCSCWCDDPMFRLSFSSLSSSLQDAKDDCTLKFKEAKYKIIHYV